MNAVITLENIQKIYRTGGVAVHAVRGVSAEVYPGEFVAIMGASGSGKSTLMNIIGCLDRPTEGRYLLDGTDVSQLTRDDLADIRNQKIGFIFQGFNLLSRTSAIENVELPMLYWHKGMKRRDQHDRAIRALEMVNLADRADHHPNQLSGGQQQRVAIARALVNEPSLLLADEPTGNLDSQTAHQVMTLILDHVREQDATLILVTHDEELAASCTDRAIRLVDGRVTSQGT